ncbi:MAG: hypothetical protein ACLGSA_02300 [Acidobacteriota bacterium]
MVTDVNHDSGDSGDTGDSGEHGSSQGGDSGQDTGFGNDDSGFSDSGNDENQNGYGHDSASEDYGHQFSPVQEHMGFTTGFGPAADLPRNAFGVPDYRGFSMPDNKANSLGFGKSPESYGSQSGMTFGTSFDPNSNLQKNAFGVPEYRGFKMPSVGPSSIDLSTGDGLTQNQPEYKGFWHAVFNPQEAYERAKTLRSWGHGFYPGEEYSDERHSTVSNFLTKEYGPTWTRMMGVANELQGFFKHDIDDLPGRIDGERPWAFSWNDLRANEVGIQKAEQEMESRK